MACAHVFYHHGEVPVRRRKNAKERREQRERAVTRAFQTVASALQNVDRHRGGKLKEVGYKWHALLLRPDAKDIPIPSFSRWRRKRTYCKVVLQRSDGSEDAASHASGDRNSIEDPHFLQDEEGEESASQEDDNEGEESASRSSGDSEGACREAALSHVSGSEASDSVSEEAAEKEVVEADPEQQCVIRRIHLPEVSRPDFAVGSNDECDICCGHSIGDIVRPVPRLAGLETYFNGEICQVIDVDEDGDPTVSYFTPDGELGRFTRLVYAEHFEQICTARFLHEHSSMPHSTWSDLLNANKHCTQELLFCHFPD